ncbi:MAG: hypothetical protein HY447_01790 [Candidatus Omnitrophica bacterium]|nr:hypothetical protein [Candidatus Omnitrophota bacterium]
MAKTRETRSLIFYCGTRRLAALVAEARSDTSRIQKFAEIRNADGFQKGNVIELDKATSSVEELLKKLDLGEEAFEIPAYVILSVPELKMTRFSSSVYYSGYPKVITSQEIRRVIDQTRSVAPLSLDDWILQAIPESFSVNNLTSVQDPTGLEAQRLAVTLQIYTTNYASFRNTSRIFESLEFNLEGYFPKTFVLPEGVLNAVEKEGETLIIDLSDEATHLVLTRDGKIAQTKSFDFGSRFLTARVAAAWELNQRDAERLKERFGSLEENPQYGEELIPLVERNGHGNGQIKRAEFHKAFLRFGEELLSQIEKEAKILLQGEKVSHPHFVLTGGGVKLEGLLDFLSRRFNTSVRLGTPKHVETMAELLMDPAWCGPSGLLRYISHEKRQQHGASAKDNLAQRTLSQVKEWFAAYF